jgi:hypothetical protein
MVGRASPRVEAEYGENGVGSTSGRALKTLPLKVANAVKRLRLLYIAGDLRAKRGVVKPSAEAGHVLLSERQLGRLRMADRGSRCQTVECRRGCEQRLPQRRIHTDWRSVASSLAMRSMSFRVT